MFYLYLLFTIIVSDEVVADILTLFDHIFHFALIPSFHDIYLIKFKYFNHKFKVSLFFRKIVDLHVNCQELKTNSSA